MPRKPPKYIPKNPRKTVIDVLKYAISVEEFSSIELRDALGLSAAGEARARIRFLRYCGFAIHAGKQGRRKYYKATDWARVYLKQKEEDKT